MAVVTIPAYPGFAKLAHADRVYFVRRIMAAGMDPVAVAQVIEFESAGTWDPAIGAPNGPPKWNKGKLKDGSPRGPVGLIQFTRTGGAKSTGTTLEKLAKMSLREQLEYVVKYFEAWPLERLNASNALNNYHMAAWGDNVGGSSRYVLASTSKNVEEYEANKQLDQYQPIGELHAWELDRVTLDGIKATGELVIDTAEPISLPDAVAQCKSTLGWFGAGVVAVAYWQKCRKIGC